MGVAVKAGGGGWWACIVGIYTFLVCVYLVFICACAPLRVLFACVHTQKEKKKNPNCVRGDEREMASPPFR